MAFNDQEDVQITDKMVSFKSVQKTVKGGKLRGFTALSVAGDRNGRVGFGNGKARELATAIQKSAEIARKNLYEIELNGTTLWYDVTAHHGASKVFLAPASAGTGIIAAGAMRAVLELVGVQDVLTKCYGSTNPINVVRATVKALIKMKSPKQIAEKRGLTVEEVLA